MRKINLVNTQQFSPLIRSYSTDFALLTIRINSLIKNIRYYLRFAKIIYLCTINLTLSNQIKLKPMKKNDFLTLFIFFAFSTMSVNAQEYKNAIGLRLGVYNGVTFKTHLNEKSAIEVYGTARLGSGYRYLTVTGLYEVRGDLGSTKGLGWYAGGGPSLSTYSSDFLGTSGGYTAIGISGIAGLEYTFADAPINLSLDWSPTFFFKENVGFTGDYFALSVRYFLSTK